MNFVLNNLLANAIMGFNSSNYKFLLTKKLTNHQAPCGKGDIARTLITAYLIFLAQWKAIIAYLILRDQSACTFLLPFSVKATVRC